MFIIGIIDRISTMTAKAESKSVTIPEPFSGGESWEDWIDQFHSFAEINHWNNEQKSMWLKVRLSGAKRYSFRDDREIDGSDG